MIRYIITDLDGTLFHGHGECLFDLTSENTEALAKAQANGIRVLPCSGRAVTYAIRLYDLFNLGEDIIAAGLNSAIIYDQKIVEKYTLCNEDVLRMVRLLSKHSDKYFNMQVQDEWNTRYFLHLDVPPATTYRNTTGKDRCTEVGEINLLEYLSSGKEICRFSIMSKIAEDSIFLEAILHEEFGKQYTVTRSSKTFLEINSKLGNKARFVQYIKEKYNLTSDEVAVIGDNHNDSFMYTESNHTFAMENGDEDLKASAKYIVKSVAECIEICLAMNEKN